MTSLAHLSVGETQRRLNRSTRGQWALYESHRKRLERLIVPERPGLSICVLGAGNCNDLDLPWLTSVYGRIHLVDLDEKALVGALEAQGVAGSRKISLATGVDLTGVGEQIDGLKRESSEVEVAPIIAAADSTIGSCSRSIGGGFDIVLSPCVLSQTLTALHERLSPENPAFDQLHHALKRRHLLLMAELLAHGGKGVLAVDVISSRKAPGLASAAEHQLSAVIRHAVTTNRHFYGLDPGSIARLCGRDPDVARVVGEYQFTAPWLWHISLRKCFCVYALVFGRKSASQPGGLAAPGAEPSLGAG